jgi:hypothetical protein
VYGVRLAFDGSDYPVPQNGNGSLKSLSLERLDDPSNRFLRGLLDELAVLLLRAVNRARVSSVNGRPLLLAFLE